jgi:hypothetical protein
MEACVSYHFVVEAHRAAVGVAIRVPGGFRFFHSDPRYFALEGRIFPRVKALVSAIGKLAPQQNRREDRASSPPS